MVPVQQFSQYFQEAAAAKDEDSWSPDDVK
jgi:hypothetical protein